MFRRHFLALGLPSLALLLKMREDLEIQICKSREDCFGDLPGDRFAVFGCVFENARGCFGGLPGAWFAALALLKKECEIPVHVFPNLPISEFPSLENGVSEAFLALGLPSLALLLFVLQKTRCLITCFQY